MARQVIKLDHAGIAEFLKSEKIADVIDGYAQQIAGSVSAMLPPGADVVVDNYTTDRAAAAVTIREPMAQAWQASDGVLTKAATAAGLEVNQIMTYTTRSGKTRRATAAQIANWTRGQQR
jgi:hypothetical protein